MKIFMLVEGARTEMKLYPAWLELLLPSYERLDIPADAVDGPLNSYFLISGGGQPELLEAIDGAVKAVNDLEAFHYLLIMIDAEEKSAAGRRKFILNHIESVGGVREGTDVHVVVQDCCIETWLLGNRRVYVRNPEDANLQAYREFYNVAKADPELMPAYQGFNTRAQFHLAYLRRMLQERGPQGRRYSKRNPGPTAEPHYLAQLQQRVMDTGHLASFAHFLEIIERIA